MLGAPIPMVRVVPLKPDPSIETFEERSRRSVAAQQEQERLEQQTAQGDDDPERSRLRQAVVEAATAFRGSPCNDEFRKQYIEAVLAYARAFVVLGGCPNFPMCRDNDAAMTQARKVFGSPADARVRDAMRSVHEMGFRLKDYPGPLAMAIDHLSGSSGRGDGQFSCAAVEAPAPRRAEEHRASDEPLPPPRRERAGWDRKQINRELRERNRKNAMEALRSPGPKLCSGRDRQVFIAGLNQYYTQRDFELHGPVVRSREDQMELEQEWSSAIDEQIDGLVREFYSEGYIRPKDLHKSATVDKVLVGVTFANRACAGTAG